MISPRPLDGILARPGQQVPPVSRVGMTRGTCRFTSEEEGRSAYGTLTRFGRLRLSDAGENQGPSLRSRGQELLRMLWEVQREAIQFFWRKMNPAERAGGPILPGRWTAEGGCPYMCIGDTPKVKDPTSRKRRDKWGTQV
jgi:hypothetical protein